MSHTVTIAGQPVELAWTQDVARRYAIRCSKIGGAPKTADLSNARRADYAATAFLWLFLPTHVHDQYQTPQDLYLAIDHEDSASSILDSIMAVFAEMVPDIEKKTSSKKSRSQKSS